MEWALRFEEESSQSYVCHIRTMAEPMWPMYPGKFVDWKSKSVRLSPTLGRAICKLVYRALLGIRSAPANEFQLDASVFHFECDHLGGNAWAPQADTFPGHLCDWAASCYQTFQRESFGEFELLTNTQKLLLDLTSRSEDGKLDETDPFNTRTEQQREDRSSNQLSGPRLKKHNRVG